MTLSKKNIDGFKYDGRTKDIRWDQKVPGLGIRIYPSGKKSFVLKYRTGPDRTRLMVLGRYGVDLTLDDARAVSLESLRALKKHKLDPLEERKKEKTTRTFLSVWQAHKKFSKAHKKKTLAEDERRFNRLIPKGWQNRPAASITPKEISELHKEIGERAPYEANRLLSLLHSMFRRAASAEFDILPRGHINPAAGIQKFKELKRKRYATKEEMPNIVKAIDEENNIYVRAAFWLYLLTGARKAELIKAKWDQVDFNNRILKLPETKSGEPQTIPLNRPAIAILKGIPQQEDNPYIFPGAKPNKPLVNLSKPWIRIRNKAGCPDLRLHDLRRSVGSWMTQAGVDLNTIKGALRHSDISTTLVYAQTSDQSARDALEAHGEELLKVTGRKGFRVVKKE